MNRTSCQKRKGTRRRKKRSKTEEVGRVESAGGGWVGGVRFNDDNREMKVTAAFH